MSILALDVGDSRIGVAMSEGFLAAPLTTIHRRNEAVDVREVLRLAEEYGAEEIVVGMPLSLSGQVGPQAKRVARFAEALAERLGAPVATTVSGHRFRGRALFHCRGREAAQAGGRKTIGRKGPCGRRGGSRHPPVLPGLQAGQGLTLPPTA